MGFGQARWAKLVTALAAAVVVIAAVVVVWRLLDRDPEVSGADVKADATLIARGEYLVRAADCAACHNAPGGKPFTGGLAFNLPFGTIYSTNITADAETGIGRWSDDDFVRALHKGVARDGSHLYPAFPYASYTGLSRDDAVAMKAYLFSLPPVHAPARPNRLAFPFNQRWTLAFWNFAFLDDHRFRPNAALTAAENRGAYLAGPLAHCGECHTPRNLGFAMETARQFGGALLEGWRAYNITSDKKYGVGDWSDQQIADYLKFGHAANRGSASEPMGEAIGLSLQYLTPQDTSALVSYLRRVEPQTGEAGAAIAPAPAAMVASTAWAPGANDPQNELGRRLFEGVCAGCHAWNGAGRETDYAALAGSQAVNDPEGVNLVEVMLSGANLRTSHGADYMPSFASAYNDTELAAVANYVIGHFGGKTGRVTAAVVAGHRAMR